MTTVSCICLQDLYCIMHTIWGSCVPAGDWPDRSENSNSRRKMIPNSPFPVKKNFRRMDPRPHWGCDTLATLFVPSSCC